MKNKRANKAVSSIVGTALLLGMAIALFSIVQILALSFPYNPNPPSARLVGNIGGDVIYIVHHGGESLSLDTKVIFTVDENADEWSVSDILNQTTSNGDNVWNIGEKVESPSYTGLNDKSVSIIVVDVESGTIMMQSTIQG